MKKQIFTVIALVFLVFSYSLQAQESRRVNLQVRLLLPQNDTSVLIGEMIDVAASFKNLGPDNAIAGDTLLYQFSGIDNPRAHIFVKGMEVNDSGTVSLQVSFDAPTDGPIDLCVIGVILGTIDDDTANNVFCISITASDEDITGIAKGNILTKGLKMFPNPAVEAVTVDYQLMETSEVYSYIMDVTGKIVQQRQLGLMNKGRHSMRLDTESLSSGTYFVEIRDQYTKSRGTLLIQ